MSEKGFTLVEVLASLVIISIVLMSFLALFGNTNRLAVTNSEKLVIVNLADAYLERAKVIPNEYITFQSPKRSCTSTKKPSFFHEVNNKKYKIDIHIAQDSTECQLQLIEVIVTVTAQNSKLSSKVEGYVQDVKTPSSN